MRDYGNTNAAPYASAPAVGLTGDTYWNTTEQALYVSNGTAWVKAGPSAAGAAGGDLTGSYPDPVLATAGARVYRSTLQTIPNNATTAIVWDTVTVNRNSAWAAGTPDRILLNVTGVYLVGSQLLLNNTTNVGNRSFTIKNKAGTVIARTDNSNSGAGFNQGFVLSTVIVVTDPTDYVIAQFYQNSGGGLDTVASHCTFFAWRLAT